MADKTRTPQWAECRGCGHRWVAFYYPVPGNMAGRIKRFATCPMCFGIKQVFMCPPEKTISGEASDG